MENGTQMTNNKQQTEINAVEWLAEQMEILHYDYWAEHISKDEKNQRLKKLIEQAKEMDKEQKEMSYSDGYAEGYKRALELTQWTISNLVPPYNERR
jgi:flagellar biosynthesis/type III secretory pathway protein FliH